MFGVSAVRCKTHSRRRHHSLMPDACKTFRHASLHIKSPTSTKFPAVQADHIRWPLSSSLLIHCCCRFYSATCPGWFCSLSYAEVLAEVVESVIRFADLRKMAPLYVIKLIRLELTCVFRTKWRWSVRKKHANSLRLQAFWRCEHSNALASRSGLIFGQPCRSENSGVSRYASRTHSIQ